MVDRISEFLEQAIEQRIFPGCTAGIIAGGHQWCMALGRLTYSADDVPVSEHTLYDVASITKSFPTALLALKLIEQGVIGLDEPLINTVPEFRGGYRQAVTIRHLLTHTLDFGFRLSSLKHLRSDSLLDSVLSTPMRSEPGTLFSYSNTTSILLGLAVERAGGLPLDIAADVYFFRPLDMHHTTFHPERISGTEAAPSEEDPWRGRTVRAEVHDESAWALRPRIAGSAGLFSTAPDMLRLAAMLLDRGTIDGMRFFLPETVAAMHTNALPPSVSGCTGLGWELNQPSFMGTKCSSDTFGKTGFTGCSAVIDPVRKAAVILLSNHTYPHRRNDRSLINEVRSRLADIVFESIDACQ